MSYNNGFSYYNGFCSVFKEASLFGSALPWFLLTGKKYAMPFHILKKETTAELWLSHRIFSTTENSKTHSNENYRKMSEDSDTKESLRPSAIKLGHGCPAKVSMMGYPILNSDEERNYFSKTWTRSSFFEQYVQECRGSQCLQSSCCPGTKRFFFSGNEHTVQFGRCDVPILNRSPWQKFLEEIVVTWGRQMLFPLCSKTGHYFSINYF